MADEWRGTLTPWDIFFTPIKRYQTLEERLRLSSLPDLFYVTRHLEGFVNAFKEGK